MILASYPSFMLTESILIAIVKLKDIRIHEAMRRTTEDMLERFQCHTAYTISDEISLLFPRISAEAEQEEPLICHPYGGRVQKIVSLCASFCGVRFNYHLSNCKMEEGDKREDMVSVNSSVLLT